MKKILLLVTLLASFGLQAGECKIAIDHENLGRAFGQKGIDSASKALRKKGFEVVDNKEQAEFLLTGEYHVSLSPWDLWSPLHPIWSFQGRDWDRNFKEEIGGVVNVRLFFGSSATRARGLARALRQRLVKCRPGRYPVVRE